MIKKKTSLRRVFALLSTIIIIGGVLTMSVGAYNEHSYTNATINRPSNKTDGVIYSSQDIYFSLWRDGFDALAYELCFVEDVPSRTSPNDVDAWDAMPRQYDLTCKGVSYWDIPLLNGVDRFIGIRYDKAFDKYHFDPSTGRYYNNISVYVNIESLGDLPDINIEDVRLVHSYHYEILPEEPTEWWHYDRRSQHTLEGFSFAHSGEYRIYLTVVFYDDVTPLSDQLQGVQNISVVNALSHEGELTKEFYDKGYNVGFNAGKNEAFASTEKWDFYSLISAVVNAPLNLLNTALDFEVFGINVANTVKFLFTMILIAFVAIVIMRLIK